MPPANTLRLFIERKVDSFLLGLATGHVIFGHTTFTDAVFNAVPAAEANQFAILVIVPSEAYLKYECIDVGSSTNVACAVTSCKEKLEKTRSHSPIISCSFGNWS